MNFPRYPRVPTFRAGRPQRLAALLLLVFLGECLWVIAHQRVSTDDYRYALCGRQMWERPNPLAGYFTTCGNLQGDGTFAYRIAAFPLTAQRLVLLGTDLLRKPKDRLYAEGSLNGSTWEARHEVSYVKYLMHLPFVLFAAWLGAGLWWVSRRLFGNEGGLLALLLYIFSPAVVRYAGVPNNEVLAMTCALGLTAAAHLLAAFVGFVASVVLMFYLAERRRSAVLLIVTYAAIGALVMEFAFFSFRLQPFTYVFTGGAGRFWFSTAGIELFAHNQQNWPVLIAAAVAVILYAAIPRSRYFGNTTPLLMVVAIVFLVSTQTYTAPWLWSLPFLFTFIGGVFADALETQHRKLFLATAAVLVLAQVAACLNALAPIARIS
jgi:hypothetical protein